MHEDVVIFEICYVLQNIYYNEFVILMLHHLALKRCQSYPFDRSNQVMCFATSEVVLQP